MFVFNLFIVFTLLYWMYYFYSSLKGWSKVKRFPNEGVSLKQPPLVSIIVAAKEEEHTIIETVKNLLRQNYPRFEIIAVNDRSEDKTGAKLNELKKWSEQKSEVKVPLHIVHITTLPKGWLGKNHALYQGYLQAKGQYLLFTDADVIFREHTLSQAIHYVGDKQIDHLTVFPNIVAKHWMLKTLVYYFFFILSLILLPWKANEDGNRKHGVGIGAFNLISRKAYEKMGTHQSFPMRVDDDLFLGKKAKKLDLKQRVAIGKEILQVEWYPSFSQAMKGLEKNIFTGFHYSLLLVSLGIVGQTLLFFFPFIGVFLFHDWRGAAYGISLFLMLFLYVYHVRLFSKDFGKEILWFPASIVLLIYILCRSVYLMLKRGGMYWRGTFYSLKELKEMHFGSDPES